MMDFEKLDSYKEHKTTASDSTERPIGYNSKGAIYPIKNNRTMSAEELLKQESDDKPFRESCFANCKSGEDKFNRSEIITFAEFYHQKEMERKLREAEKEMEKEKHFNHPIEHQGIKRLLNHLKEQKQDKG